MILGVTIKTGNRYILSDNNKKGTGPKFKRSKNSVQIDPATLIVIDSAISAIFKVKLPSGDRTIISQN